MKGGSVCTVLLEEKEEYLQSYLYRRQIYASGHLIKPIAYYTGDHQLFYLVLLIFASILVQLINSSLLTQVLTLLLELGWSVLSRLVRLSFEQCLLGPSYSLSSFTSIVACIFLINKLFTVDLATQRSLHHNQQKIKRIHTLPELCPQKLLWHSWTFPKTITGDIALA